jgi:hypothetical protein
MRYRVLAPAEPSDAIPRGAAVLEHRRCAQGAAYARVYAGRDRFGELCAQAAQRGRLVALPEDCAEIGYYDAIDGELHLQRHQVATLAGWLGHPVSRNDLEARDNRTVRRHRARRLFYQGRYVEAARIDRRMGL